MAERVVKKQNSAIVDTWFTLKADPYLTLDQGWFKILKWTRNTHLSESMTGFL